MTTIRPLTPAEIEAERASLREWTLDEAFRQLKAARAEMRRLEAENVKLRAAHSREQQEQGKKNP